MALIDVRARMEDEAGKANGSLAVYPDAGHAFLFQDERTFVARVDAFLR